MPHCLLPISHRPFPHTPAMLTLQTEIVKSGIGVHTGVKTTVRVKPANVGEGRYFVRVDLGDRPIVPARVEAVVSTTLSTEIGWGETRIRTVEHLLAALTGLGIENACIEIDGPEVPLLDGSAAEWVEILEQAAIARKTTTQTYPRLNSPLWVQQDDAFVCALPAPETRFTYGIDFDVPAIANQWHSWQPTSSDFATEIAPARTFALAHHLDRLRSQGLIKGGNLDNALVCSVDGWINPPLRFANEPVRHKLLDLVGDLSLLGTIPVAHYLAYKASHRLHVQLAQRIVEFRSR